MAKTYSDLFAEVRQSVKLLSLDELKARLETRKERPFTLVDVREKDEFRAGFIPGAVHIPRAHLEMQAEQKLPDKNAEIILYCAGGTRSAFAAKTLADFGYTNVLSANPGFVRWKDLKYPIEEPVALTPAQQDRYSRHILLPEVGEKMPTRSTPRTYNAR
jgi:rhodanese-related sulfurtransferase